MALQSVTYSVRFLQQAEGAEGQIRRLMRIVRIDNEAGRRGPMQQNGMQKRAAAFVGGACKRLA